MRQKILLILIMFFSILPIISCDRKTDITDDYFIITDILDRAVKVKNNPQRIVCLGPNSLRLYTYIADITKIVGIENFEIIQTAKGRPYIELYQGFIDSLPVISEGGPKATPNPESILEVNPDLIIISSHYELNVIENLTNSTNIPVVAITNDVSEGTIFSDNLINSLEIIGLLTGNETRAKDIIDYLSEVKDDLYNRTKDIVEINTAYIGSLSKAGHQQITSTSGDYEIFDLVNITNLARTNLIENHAIVDKETLLMWNPETIFIDANGYELLINDMKVNPDFYSSLIAFKNANVYLQMPYNFYSTNLEVALANAYFCGIIVYPDLFSDINIETKVNEISQFFLNIDVNDILIEDFYGGYQKLF